MALEKVAENNRVWRSSGSLPHDLADVVDEAHVEHAIALIQHQRVYLRQVDSALIQVIQQPTGGSHHHINPPDAGGSFEDRF